MNPSCPNPFSRLKILLCFGILTTALIFSLSACSGGDVAGNTTCSSDTDCDLGSVCNASDLCIQASCEHCTEGQICYISDANPEGTCSAPECQLAEDCDEGQPCIGGVCGGESNGNGDCSSNSDCDNGEVCNLLDRCVPGGGSGDLCDGPADCDTDTEFCDPDTDECTPIVDCGSVDCGPGEVCVEPYGTCQFDCNIDTSGACSDDQFCHEPSGECRTNSCPDLDPSECTGTTPHFDDTACECSQCLATSDCPAGQECNGGTCEQSQGGACETACSSNDPGVCGATANTPYCIDNCCVQCLGAADCSGDDICIDGFCSSTPDCSIDPCPSGFDCVNQVCEPTSAGAGCSEPGDCPSGQFCDATTETCQSLGGGGGTNTGACGFCNDDCTCDNGLTCDPLVGACTGCSVDFDFGTGQIIDDCPSGQSCDLITLLFGFPICLPD